MRSTKVRKASNVRGRGHLPSTRVAHRTLAPGRDRGAVSRVDGARHAGAFDGEPDVGRSRLRRATFPGTRGFGRERPRPPRVSEPHVASRGSRGPTPRSRSLPVPSDASAGCHPRRRRAGGGREGNPLRGPGVRPGSRTRPRLAAPLASGRQTGLTSRSARSRLPQRYSFETTFAVSSCVHAFSVVVRV